MGLFDILKGNAYTTAEKNKLAAIDPSKFITVEQYELLKEQLKEVLHLIPQVVDTSKFVTLEHLPDLSAYARVSELPTMPDLQPYALSKDVPKPIDTSKFALKSDVPSLSGYARLTDIPKAPDLSLYALKTDIPDTVKYVENSNTKSTIKKISLSIDDKGTFKAESNPVNNIAHTI